MRVIAGDKRGIALRGGKGPVFRPTAQVVKGSIFDTLGQAVRDASFMDLFAGAGGVGIEALSRGAAHAIFVEQDHRILKALRTNLQRCGFGRDRALVRPGDAMRFLDRFAASGETVDILFADPPYAGILAQRVVEIVSSTAGGACETLVVEHARPVHAGQDSGLKLTRSRKFGQTHISYFGFGE